MMQLSLTLESQHPHSSVPIGFTAQSGDIVIIHGASGQGKSTLLRQIWGSSPLPEHGRVTLSNQTETWTLSQMTPATLAFIRPKVMRYVGQEPYVLKRDRLQSWFGDCSSALSAAMYALDLPSTLLERRAGEVSGGELQRFVLLEAIFARTPILLLDEPLTGLDDGRAERVMDLLRLNANDGTMVILTSHSILECADHIVDLNV